MVFRVTGMLWAERSVLERERVSSPAPSVAAA